MSDDVGDGKAAKGLRKGVVGMTAKPNCVRDRFDGMRIGCTPGHIRAEGRGGAVGKEVDG